MTEKRIANLRDWVEPAHDMVVKLRNDLMAIYTRIHDVYQGKIDEVFDQVSRQIGFVVAITLPITFEVNEKGRISSVGLAAAHLKDTVFYREFGTVFAAMVEDSKPIKGVEAATYDIYLLWQNALKLRLRTDWMEPAHFRRWLDRMQIPSARMAKAQVPYEVMEPAHWFEPHPDPWHERLIISVIDEVYTDLRLAEAIISIRESVRHLVPPEVKEPAHYRDLARRLTPEALAEIDAILRKGGY
jgi:hypothetical protein